MRVCDKRTSAAVLRVFAGLARGAFIGGALACAPVALGQDSVASAPGLPGDATSAYAAGTGSTAEQVNNYVVDLTEFRSSWGQRYLMGPVAKASLSQQSTFFNHLIASTTVSSTLSPVQALARSSYAVWTTPGAGVNATRNSAPGSVSGVGLQAQQLTAGFLEFGPGANNIWGDSDDENNIIAAVIGVRPRLPDRVYVSRVVAASNRTSVGNANATLGLGTADSAGNVHFSGDGFGMSLGANPISNKKLFRVPALLRSASAVNAISESGGTDAATRVLSSITTTETVPGIVPSQLGTRPVMIAADLANNYQSEATANGTSLTNTQTHLPTGASGRGSLGFSPYVFGGFTGGGTPVGTAAIMARNTGTTKTRSLAAWGVASNGAVAGRTLVEMPSSAGVLIDRDDAFDPSAAFGSLENQEFTNYQSQAVYRGASGPVAVTVLANGDLLLAATVASTGTGAAVPQGMNNYIAVARTSPGNVGSATWSIAAHTGNAAGAAGGLSKAVFGDNGLDGLPGTGDAGEGDNQVDATPIGFIALASEVFPGATSGPSISAPAFDSAGNVYFTATVQLRDAVQARGTVALLRANFDPATNAYRLEMLAEVGRTIAGRNSGRNYQIEFMSVADADSIDSGTTWSSSTVQQPLAGVDRATVGYGSPLSLGGAVFRAKIIYDTNNDGVYSDPSGGDSGSDEAYNVLMLMLPRRALADIAGPGQSPSPDNQYTADDIIVFLNAFFAGNLPVADIAGPGQSLGGDGDLTADDIIVFLNAFFSGQ